MEIDTPAVIVDSDKLQRNISAMAQFARKHGVKLRPHIKTHKMVEIAKVQLEAGAVGIATAKIGEAEVMADHGITDILVAYPIIGEEKLHRLKKLKERATVATVVDSVEQAEVLSRFAKEHCLSFDLLIEVDTGLKRCGVLPGEPVKELYQKLSTLPGLHVRGILTHAGHAYGASRYEEVRKIGLQEGTLMVETAQLLRKSNLPLDEISVGSTPTVRLSGSVDGVTEIRPGNYVFNDMTQVRLGVAKVEDCALRVVARIVGQPASDRFIIDAGAKSLALDQGAHGTTGVKGYGYIVGHPELTITRLSEEHGIVQIEGNTLLKIGSLVEIIPNHSCPVVNLTETVSIVQQGKNH